MPTIRAIAALAISAAMAIGIASPTLVAVSAEGPAAAPPPLSMTASPAPAIDMTNLEIVASLDDRGACLFRNGVFPAGGVGYADSSLPYDHLDDAARATSIYRAELLRAFPAQLAGITIPLSSGAENIVSAVQGSSALARELGTLDAATREALLVARASSPQLEAAVVLLDTLGIERSVQMHAHSNLLAACAVQESLFDGSAQEAAGIGGVGVLTGVDASTGELVVEVPAAYVAALDGALSAYAGSYRIVPFEGSLSFQVGG